MKIEKKKINGYDVYWYNTDKYATINMRFLFEMDYTKENIYKCDLLEEYMLYSNELYKTRKALSDKRMELYSVHYGMNNFNVGKKLFVEVMFNFYDPVLVKDDYLKEALKFASDLLFKPNFEGGVLDKDELERAKGVLSTKVGDELMDFRRRARKEFLETLYPNSYKTVDLIDTRAEFDEMLASFTDESLIEMHDKLLESVVGLVIQGNIKPEYLDYIEEFFKFKGVLAQDEDYEDILRIADGVEDYYHLTDEDYKESIIRCVYDVPINDLKDRMVYSTIASMCGSTGLLLHKMLRENLHIVYSTKATFIWKLGRLTFVADIDGVNEKKAIEGFDRVLESLKDRELVEGLLNQIKEANELFMYTFDENKWNPFFAMYDSVFDFDVSEQERIDLVASLTVDDIEEALTKMKKRCVFFYEGVKK